MVNYDKAAKSKEKIAVRTAQLLTSLPIAAPSEEAAPLAETEALVSDGVDETDDEVCIPLGVGVILALAEGTGVIEAELLAEGAPGREAVADALLPPAMLGGGEAWEGSTSWPVPQGMAAPVPGWFLLAGGTDSPLGPARTKRPVQ
jgi:hypothetical protein